MQFRDKSLAMQFLKTSLTIGSMMLPMIALAHEGHGYAHGGELIHYLISPVHVVPVALALAIALILFWSRNRSKETI